MKTDPLDRFQFDAGELIETYPPRWGNRNKQAVYDLIRSSADPFAGRIVYSRWAERQLPRTVSVRGDMRIHRGVFTYSKPANPADVEWHMNFADPHLFVAYGSPLLAQDELQVAEHPILGSLREALDSLGKTAKTIEARYGPTPITISGVQRRCAIDTHPNPGAGRPGGLYGNAFARAAVSDVVSATKIISPPTITNILAMSAPTGGYGHYREDEISYIVTTAYTGFLAAGWQSAELAPSTRRTIVHNGFWGCGAFGGNRTLMTMLQSLAADLAGVDLEFHAFDEVGVAVAEDAVEQYRRMASAMPSVPELLRALYDKKYHWGESDGN